MRELEARAQPYLFKLRLSKNVKRHIERLFRVSGWATPARAGKGSTARWRLPAGRTRAAWSCCAAPCRARCSLPRRTTASSCWASSKPTARAASASPATSTRCWSPISSTNPLARPALPGPGRRGEHLRRAQEPVGLGWLHHARSASLPTVGACGGTDLQLVESVCASGQPRSATRGHHQPALVDVLGRSAHRACRPDHDHADRPACPLRQGPAGAHAHLQPASSLGERSCGAVQCPDRSGMQCCNHLKLAANISSAPSRPSDHRQPSVC
jgi:hypothetical protein